MKQSIYIFIVLLILCKSNVNGQQFDFTLYFEDARGNTDSVMLGFDKSATYELDTAFGEIDISKIPYDSVFEVRGATYRYPLVCNSLNNRDQLIFESKKLITYNSCDFTVPLEGKSAMVTIKSKYTPVKVTWDSTLFNTSCIKSYLVNWQPGGWFDACCCNGGSDIGLIELNANSSFTFSSTDFQFLTETDTVFTLFFPLSNDDIVEINHLTEENGLLIYPNPLSGKGVLEFENTTNDLYRFTIYDNNGGIVAQFDKIRDNKFEFQLNNCSNGLYYYELTIKRNKKRFSGKFIYNRK